MTNLLESAEGDHSGNLLWKNWQEAKKNTVRTSWEKENSREHWRAMIEECKAECAWMVEQNRLQTLDLIATDVMKLVAEILLGRTHISPPADGTAP